METKIDKAFYKKYWQHYSQMVYFSIIIMIRHVSRSSGLAKTILQGTVEGIRKKEKEANRRRDGKTMS